MTPARPGTRGPTPTLALEPQAGAWDTVCVCARALLLASHTAVAAAARDAPSRASSHVGSAAVLAARGAARRAGRRACRASCRHAWTCRQPATASRQPSIAEVFAGVATTRDDGCGAQPLACCCFGMSVPRSRGKG